MRVNVVRYGGIRPGGDRLWVDGGHLTWAASEDGVTEEGAAAYEAGWEWLVANTPCDSSIWPEAIRSFDHRVVPLEGDIVAHFDCADPRKGGHLRFDLSPDHFTQASVNALNVNLREWLISQGAVRPYRSLAPA